MNQLTATDYIVITTYLLGILLIGALFSRRQTSLREYFLASRNIPWWAAGISVFATLLSANSFPGGPGWVFARDSRFLITGGVIGVERRFYLQPSGSACGENCPSSLWPLQLSCRVGAPAASTSPTVLHRAGEFGGDIRNPWRLGL